MSEYEYRPRPIEAQALIVKKQLWGEEITIAKTHEYTGKVLRYDAGKAGGLQFHTRKDETFFLFSGEAWVDYDQGDGKLTRTWMGPGGSYHIPPGAVHRFEAITDCVVFEASTNVSEDRVRCERYYGEPEVEGLPSTAPEPVR